MDGEDRDSRFREGVVIAGKYALTHTLGQGGMGLVVAAMHLQLERRVAIKFLLPQHLEKSEVVSRFTREARSAAKIQSDHVAHVLDVGVDEGTPYMVMEYLEGEDLKEILKRRGPLSVEEAVRHMMHACEAIAEAHALGIVHRDLKPANLFLAKRANGKTILKVLDFGISKIMNPATETELTLTSRAVGSPSYMSPEQLAASRSLDGRADVWALGVVLYELLTRQRPFFGESMPTIVAQILKGRFEKLDDLRPDLPLPLVHAVHRCLELEPEHRFASVVELAAALAPFAPAESVSSLEGLPPVAPRPSLAPSDDATPGGAHQANLTGAASAMSAAVRPREPPSRGRLVAAAAASALVVLVSAGLLAMRSGRPSSPAAAPPIVASDDSARASSSPAPSPTPPTPPTPPTEAAPLVSPLGSGTPAASAPATVSREPAAAPPRPNPRARTTQAASGPVPSAPVATAAPAPDCHLVSYFDALGDKHFKQECH